MSQYYLNLLKMHDILRATLLQGCFGNKSRTVSKKFPFKTLILVRWYEVLVSKSEFCDVIEQNSYFSRF